MARSIVDMTNQLTLAVGADSWTLLGYRTFSSLPLVAILLIAFAGFELMPGLAETTQLEVLPVIFVPSDNQSILTRGQIESIKDLLYRHIVLAQAHYRSMLETDTFKISGRGVVVFNAAQPASAYPSQEATSVPDSAHIILKELFEWTGEDRHSSRTVYVVVFARPAYSPGFLGGGRTFNGRPNTGGGYVHLELSSLLTDKPYPFQSTLVHELGHGFGLTHVDCHGYDLATSESIMGYNLRHHSKGLVQSQPLAGLTPEDFFVLAQNKLAFPHFAYSSTKHNPANKQLTTIDSCYLGAMTSAIGTFRRMPGVGYELLYDGKVVNGPETAFWSRTQARNNCAWNKRSYPSIRIECLYDGRTLEIE